MTKLNLNEEIKNKKGEAFVLDEYTQPVTQEELDKIGEWVNQFTGEVQVEAVKLIELRLSKSRKSLTLQRALMDCTEFAYLKGKLKSLYTLRSVASKLEMGGEEVEFTDKELKLIIDCLGLTPDEMYRSTAKLAILDILDKEGKFEEDK